MDDSKKSAKQIGDQGNTFQNSGSDADDQWPAVNNRVSDDIGVGGGQQQQQPSQPVSAPQKELLPTSEVGQGEKVPLVELKEDEKIPEDVQGWVEKLQNEDVKLPEPIQDHGKVVLAEPDVTFKDDRIVLPLSQKSYTQGMKQKVNTSVRWLVEWCGRLIKMLGDRAKFRETTGG